MVALVGKKLKDYQVLRRLGSGAMADVYLAQQLSLDRPIALKVLNAELAHDPAYVRRFHHEARSAAALSHTAIVQIYEVGQEDGIHFIAQEFVPGQNLGEVIRGHGRLDPGITVDILRQVAAAIAKADSAGIVHRDIKPENIMLSPGGEVKVADFGLARVQDDHPSGGARGLNLTQIGVTMGTPLYMSPEQIEGRDLDSRSDIYSLGVTAYHMLSGSPPFSGDTPLAVAVQHLNQPPEPLASRCADVPGPLAELVTRMLAKRPEDRCAGSGALVRELSELSQQGAAQGWANATEPWSLAAMVAGADNRSRATSRLDAAMKTSALAIPSGRKSWSVVVRSVVALALCTLAGIAVALLTRPNPLLVEHQIGSKKLDNVWAQLYHAKSVDTVEAWQAVDDHFGDDDEYYRHLAAYGLAQYYLFRGSDEEHESALEPLSELAQLGDSSAMQAFGVAGLVVAHAKLENEYEALLWYLQLTTEMKELITGPLNELLDQALEELDRPRR